MYTLFHVDIFKCSIKAVYMPCHVSMCAEVVFTDPADCGFGCVSRKRSFTIFIRRDAGRFLASPQALYDRMRDVLSKNQLAIEDLLWADQAMIQSEKESLVNASRSASKRSLSSLLTEWETKNQAIYELLLDETNIPLSAQVYGVGQNPEFLWKATSKEQVLPAITATDRLLWVRNGERPMTAAEKFVAHGYPMRTELAELLGVPAS